MSYLQMVLDFANNHNLFKHQEYINFMVEETNIPEEEISETEGGEAELIEKAKELEELGK